jgi:hypothetical protein
MNKFQQKIRNKSNKIIGTAIPFYMVILHYIFNLIRGPVFLIAMYFIPSLHWVIGIKTLAKIIYKVLNLNLETNYNYDLLIIGLRLLKTVLELEVLTIPSAYGAFTSNIMFESINLTSAIVQAVAVYNLDKLNPFAAMPYLVIVFFIRQVLTVLSYFSIKDLTLKYPVKPINILTSSNNLINSRLIDIFYDLRLTILKNALTYFAYLILDVLLKYQEINDTEEYQTKYKVGNNMITDVLTPITLLISVPFKLDTSKLKLDLVKSILKYIGMDQIYLTYSFYLILSCVSVLPLILLDGYTQKPLLDLYYVKSKKQVITYLQLIGIMGPNLHQGFSKYGFNLTFFIENIHYLVINYAVVLYSSFIDYMYADAAE